MDLSQETPAVTLLEEETILVTKAGEKESYEAIQKINELFLNYAADGVASKPSISRSLSFSAQDDGSDTSYEWDFGDGTVKSGKDATHVYKTPNSYLITITASNFLGSKSESRRVTVNAPYWALDADNIGNGWKSFDWFGAYFEQADSSWIFHQRLGWLYRHGETIDDTWFWSDMWNWGWTSDQTFPYLAKSTGDWLYYLPSSYNPTMIYDYGLSKWLSGNQLDNCFARHLPHSPIIFAFMRTLFFLFLLSPLLLFADVPVAHSGHVSVNGSPFNGTGKFKFSIVNQFGSVIWNHDGSVISTPTGELSLPVRNGFYSLHLGDSSIPGMSTLPATSLRSTEKAFFGSGLMKAMDPSKKIGGDIALGAAPFALVSNSPVVLPKSSPRSSNLNNLLQA